MISVNEDPLGAGGKRIGYDNTGTCKEVGLYSWVAFHVYLNCFYLRRIARFGLKILMMALRQ